MKDNDHMFGVIQKNSIIYKGQRVRKRLLGRKRIRTLGEKGKYALERLFDLINDANEQKENCFLLGKIDSSGHDANTAVLSLDLPNNHLPLPYDISKKENLTGMGVFVDRPAMEKIHENSRAWIHEILKNSIYTKKDNRDNTVLRGNELHLIDNGRFSVNYDNKECILNNTETFKLIKLLFDANSNWVSHTDILAKCIEDSQPEEHIDESETQKVTQLKMQLCKKLNNSGLKKLANAIKSTKGHYRLDLATITSTSNI